jgi:antitoxin VapB
MIDLSQETEALAKRLAAAQNISLDDAIREALEERALAKGVMLEARRPRRRLTVDQMLAVGDEIAAMPLLDTRSPREIIDDINA